MVLSPTTISSLPFFSNFIISLITFFKKNSNKNTKNVRFASFMYLLYVIAPKSHTKCAKLVDTKKSLEPNILNNDVNVSILKIEG